jgi:hypothetical protein
VTICRPFRDAYRERRCIVPVDGFFEWKAIKGQKSNHIHRDERPRALCQNWKQPDLGGWIRRAPQRTHTRIPGQTIYKMLQLQSFLPQCTDYWRLTAKGVIRLLYLHAIRA